MYFYRLPAEKADRRHHRRALELVDHARGGDSAGPKIGWAETREEAQPQFAEAWRDWLTKTGLCEVDPAPLAKRRRRDYVRCRDAARWSHFEGRHS